MFARKGISANFGSPVLCVLILHLIILSLRVGVPNPVLFLILFLLVVARRHNKLALESKHKILRDTFIRLREENPEACFSLLIARMFDISNVIYGNNIVSAYGIYKEYSKPITPGGSPLTVPDSLLDA